MIEIERKFRLSQEKKAQILNSLETQGADLTPIHQIDQVFLHGIESFKEFKPGMPVVRLRTVNEKTTLTYKRAINDAGDSLEHETDVDSAQVMQSILEEMGYKQVTLVDKTRIEIKKDELTVVVDNVARLGDFLELEILAEEADSGDAEERILSAAAEYGLTRDDVETKKYDQLLSSLPA